MLERVEIVLYIHRCAFLDGPRTEERIGGLEKHAFVINLASLLQHTPDDNLTESDLGLGDTEAEPTPWFEGAEMGEEALCGGESEQGL